MRPNKKDKNIVLGVCGGISAYKSCELVRLLVKNGYSVRVVMTEAAEKFVSPLVFQTLSKNPVSTGMFNLSCVINPWPSLEAHDFTGKDIPRVLESKKSKILKRKFLLKEEVKHVSLAQWASTCVIAPLSANTLSKIALGLCDNLLTTVVAALSSDVNVVCVPAMNENMWKNPLLQKNVKKIKSIKKYLIVSPRTGELACGDYGEGRMAEPKEILKVILEG